jgi:hypothetical protein
VAASRCSNPGSVTWRALVLLAVFDLGSATSAHAWGARTHEIINRVAVDHMPEPARTVWVPFAPALGRHASDADHRKSTDPSEGPRHYIDLDAYDKHPFSRVSRDLSTLRRQRGHESVERWGTVPWAIEECYRMLVLSLQRGDWSSAGAWASDLGHYVGDSHQPLHCTVNYDGQNTGNDGIHLRFEVTMMDRHFDEGMITREMLPEQVATGAVESCFQWISEAYPGLAPLLAADDVATSVDPSYGDAYYSALWRGTERVAVLQVSRAVRDLARLYASAWDEAGRPSGPVEVPAFYALPVEVLDPKEPRPKTSRAAWVVAGGVVLGAFVFGSAR